MLGEVPLVEGTLVDVVLAGEARVVVVTSIASISALVEQLDTMIRPASTTRRWGSSRQFPTRFAVERGICFDDPMAQNVLGGELESCSLDPLTGFYRDGCCTTGADDQGVHIVCTRVTEEFLAFSKAAGNDLSTPMPMYSFPGLQPGDQWCLCADRWVEAFEAGTAPQVVLEATHAAVLEWVTLATLREFEYRPTT